MRELPVLTTELTLALERSVTPEERGPDSLGNEVRKFGRTVACKTVRGWPPSRVFGFGGDDVGRLGEILEFFGGIEATFYLSHARFTREVGEALREAGFYLCDWAQTILYGLPKLEPAELPAGVTIELVTRETIEVAAEVAALGNEWNADWRENAKDRVRRVIEQEGLELFLVRCDGEPAGVGHLARIPTSEKWAGIGGAAVVPGFRRKGVHTALLGHRLYRAHELGYELVAGGAFFDTASFRNQQRVGMRLAYIETAWKRLKR
jgi:GNAT superfamily N-acetyltransferase